MEVHNTAIENAIGYPTEYQQLAHNTAMRLSELLLPLGAFLVRHRTLCSSTIGYQRTKRTVQKKASEE